MPANQKQIHNKNSKLKAKKKLNNKNQKGNDEYDYNSTSDQELSNNINEQDVIHTKLEKKKKKMKAFNTASEEDLNNSLKDDAQSISSNYSASEFELTKQDRTLIIKNLSRTIDEEQLQEFIQNKSPLVNLEDIRIVRDKKGFSKGFAFVDFIDKKEAEKCLNDINGKILEDQALSCAISKPPSAG